MSTPDENTSQRKSALESASADAKAQTASSSDIDRHLDAYDGDLSEDERAALDRFDPGTTLPRRAISELVRLTSLFVMNVLNHVEAINPERYRELIRDRTRGLLTFSNHVTLFDDPFLPAVFGVDNHERLRWVAADALNFFSSRAKAILFNAGKTVPIVRGGGVDQPGMRFLTERLAAGDWIHFFPEGGRTRHPDGRLRTPFKRGIGELIAATRPIALPYLHRGMESILPVGAKLPGVGNEVHVLFGEPKTWDDDAIASLDAIDPVQALTDWAQSRLEALQSRLDELLQR